jgi:hypothetical protein
MAYFNHTHLAGSYVSKEQPHSKPRKRTRSVSNWKYGECAFALQAHVRESKRGERSQRSPLFDVEKRSDEIYALRGMKTVLLFGSVCRNKINDYF